MKTYIISNGAGRVKIGRTKNLIERLKTLRTAIPDLELLLTLDGDQEKDLHNLFSHLHIRGEWFRHEEDINRFISNGATPSPPLSLPEFQFAINSLGHYLQFPEQYDGIVWKGER